MAAGQLLTPTLAIPIPDAPAGFAWAFLAHRSRSKSRPRSLKAAAKLGTSAARAPSRWGLPRLAEHLTLHSPPHMFRIAAYAASWAVSPVIVTMILCEGFKPDHECR
jgi:hypothetical protein